MSGVFRVSPFTPPLSHLTGQWNEERRKCSSLPPSLPPFLWPSAAAPKPIYILTGFALRVKFDNESWWELAKCKTNQLKFIGWARFWQKIHTRLRELAPSTVATLISAFPVRLPAICPLSTILPAPPRSASRGSSGSPSSLLPSFLPSLRCHHRLLISSVSYPPSNDGRTDSTWTIHEMMFLRRCTTDGPRRRRTDAALQASRPLRNEWPCRFSNFLSVHCRIRFILLGRLINKRSHARCP